MPGMHIRAGRFLAQCSSADHGGELTNPFQMFHISEILNCILILVLQAAVSLFQGGAVIGGTNKFLVLLHYA